MTPVTIFADKEVALFGLGGSGLATALALKAGGAKVMACDDNPAKMAEAEALGVDVADLREADWTRFSALVLSPGVPLTHPEPHWTAKFAREAGIEIIGDIELFCRERAKVAPNAPLIAITGTNGKSTTTALITHILRESGHDVQMGGNIGTAILALEPPVANRVYVVECSSFQIDLAPSLAPDVGLLLNISPDHLDRHGTMANYTAIKERLVAHAKTAVISSDDEGTLPVLKNIAAKFVNDPAHTLVRIATDDAYKADVFLVGEDIYLRLNSMDRIIMADLTGIPSLRGRHNGQNACAAFATLMAAPFLMKPEVIAQHLRTFPGLHHRMEQVGHVGPVAFVNDSKATNADSAEKALLSFNCIYWIAGGKPKEGGITSLTEHFGRVRHAYLIGEASQEFAATLEGKVSYTLCETMENAVVTAAKNAALEKDSREPVVLLSPACASYDQYPNFEVRGNHFRQLVQALPGFNGKVN
ncbi:UDP-N-acetylmuramoyl-L-alanine--D-glutamate ligase [Microvirga sp. W0021]|uniref:UDP-N-acetylmuramoylalanine--D-glutamate ligase n=1 Tax=Hohaiivirga grylli TaxID=3133970 RepID=A0ABV0BJZ8_9HYPH